MLPALTCPGELTSAYHVHRMYPQITIVAGKQVKKLKRALVDNRRQDSVANASERATGQTRRATSTTLSAEAGPRTLGAVTATRTAARDGAELASTRHGRPLVLADTYSLFQLQPSPSRTPRRTPFCRPLAGRPPAGTPTNDTVQYLCSTSTDLLFQ